MELVTAATDAAEVVARPAGQTPHPTRAGGQDDGSYTNSLKQEREILHARERLQERDILQERERMQERVRLQERAHLQERERLT